MTGIENVEDNLSILFDEQGEEHVVGWYRYANGTKKPVYQKEIKYTDFSNPSSTGNNCKAFSVPVVTGDIKMETVLNLYGFMQFDYGDNNISKRPINGILMGVYTDYTSLELGKKLSAYTSVSSQNIGLTLGTDFNPYISTLQAIITIQYTKFNDTAV